MFFKNKVVISRFTLLYLKKNFYSVSQLSNGVKCVYSLFRCNAKKLFTPLTQKKKIKTLSDQRLSVQVSANSLVKTSAKVRSPSATLTKKQKKRIKFKKLKKVIRPKSSVFLQSIRISRSQTIFNFFFNSDAKFIIHDGYSWWVKEFRSTHEGLKSGSICFHTRAISPISLLQKGKSSLEMKQNLTFKVKTFKVKRKK